MARPRKTGLDYFAHDTGARNNKKIIAMRNLYGNDGYVFYFIILENCYDGKKPGLDLKDNRMRMIVRHQIGVDVGLFDEMLEMSLQLELFDRVIWEKSQVLTNKRIKETWGMVEKERKRWRLSRGKRHRKPRSNPTNKTKQNKNTPQTPRGGGGDIIQKAKEYEQRLEAMKHDRTGD